MPVLLMGTVLGDDDHAVDGEFTGPERQRVGDGRADLHGGMAIRAILPDIALAMLVDVERDDVQLRAVVDAVPSEAVEEAVDDMLRVQILLVRCRDGGKTWPLWRCWARCHAELPQSFVHALGLVTSRSIARGA